MADRPLQTLVSPDRTVQQCRDIFVRQLGCAIEELSERKPNVHGARKQLKRARATLRLLRPAVGDGPIEARTSQLATRRGRFEGTRR